MSLLCLHKKQNVIQYTSKQNGKMKIKINEKDLFTVKI